MDIPPKLPPTSDNIGPISSGPTDDQIAQAKQDAIDLSEQLEQLMKLLEKIKDNPNPDPATTDQFMYNLKSIRDGIDKLHDDVNNGKITQEQEFAIAGDGLPNKFGGLLASFDKIAHTHPSPGDKSLIDMMNNPETTTASDVHFYLKDLFSDSKDWYNNIMVPSMADTVQALHNYDGKTP